MKRHPREQKPTLRNPLNGEIQYGGAMWGHREIEAGIVEEVVTMPVRRWKMDDVGRWWRQDMNNWDAVNFAPWVQVYDAPMSIQLFFSRFARGERIDGSQP